jgi:hypothetical protein
VVFVGKSNALNGKSQPAADFSKMFTRLGAKSASSANSTTSSPSTPAKV